MQIGAKLVRVYLYVKQPQRVWLLADGEVYMLGEDTICLFGGATSVPFALPAPIPPTPITPPRPNCTCIGNSCTPPGCRK